jgi:hypothetical protein
VEEEIARVNRVVVTMLKGQNEERKYCLRYLEEPESEQGILVIQHAFTEENLRALASVFQRAVEYIDRQ